MSIVLFAIIGATIKAGVSYWICFGLHCFYHTTKFLMKIMKELIND